MLNQVLTKTKSLFNIFSFHQFLIGGKLRGLGIVQSGQKEFRIVAQHSSNQLQIHLMKQIDEGHEKEFSSLGKLSLPGMVQNNFQELKKKVKLNT